MEPADASTIKDASSPNNEARNNNNPQSPSPQNAQQIRARKTANTTPGQTGTTLDKHIIEKKAGANKEFTSSQQTLHTDVSYSSNEALHSKTSTKNSSSKAEQNNSTNEPNKQIEIKADEKEQPVSTPSSKNNNLQSIEKETDRPLRVTLTMPAGEVGYSPANQQLDEIDLIMENAALDGEEDDMEPNDDNAFEYDESDETDEEKDEMFSRFHF